MNDWKPIRKIAAALAVALLGNGGALTLYLTGAIDGRAALAAGIAAIAPVLAGYITGDGAARLTGGYALEPDPGEPEHPA
ncbi:hypothetical protein [Microcystis phage Mae-JY09]